MFCEFDKNDIHKNYTYIFSDQHCYSIKGIDYLRVDYEKHGKEYVKDKYEKKGLRKMTFCPVEFDQKFEFNKTGMVSINTVTGDYVKFKTNKLSDDVKDAAEKYYLQHVFKNVNEEDPRYNSLHFYEVLKYMLRENSDLSHKL